jgi:hypothetical protein
MTDIAQGVTIIAPFVCPNKRKPIVAACPRTINTKVRGEVIPPVVTLPGCGEYINPTPVGDNYIYTSRRFAVTNTTRIQVTNEDVTPTNSVVPPNVNPTMNTVQSGFAKSSDRIQQPTIVDNFFNGIANFFSGK